MKNFKNVVSALLKDESGQDLIDYALVAGLIGLGAVVTMTTLGTSIHTKFTAITAALTAAT